MIDDMWRRSLIACSMVAWAGLANAGQLQVQTLHLPGNIRDLVTVGGDVVVRAADGRAYGIVWQGLVPMLRLREPNVDSAEKLLDMLPDGEIGAGRDGGRAWLIGPTTRYAHGILGDAIEADGLRLERPGGAVVEYRLDPGSVFEDRRVRFGDLDGDGEEELLVVRSRLDAGSSLLALKVAAGRVEALAETPAIGLPNRWLNPIGVADFDGDGRPEVALVTTPHIGGVLRLYRLNDGHFRETLSEAGFSNHVIGSRDLDMSMILDVNDDGVPDILLPSADRTRLFAVTANRGQITYLWEIRHAAKIVTALRAAAPDAGGIRAVVYGLEDGTLVVIAWSPE